jgi:hypothetical protein
MTKIQVRECLMCKYHSISVDGYNLQCAKGHKPRFYSKSWNWTRRCADFSSVVCKCEGWELNIRFFDEETISKMKFCPWCGNEIKETP